MTGSNRALNALGCCVVVSGRRARVAIHSGAEREFDGLDERKKVHLLRVMELWCEGQRLTPEQYNPSEKRARKGDVNVLVGAFKAFKNRLYGTVLDIDNQPTFVIVDVDPAKKQQRANKGILGRACGRAIAVAEQLAAAKKDEWRKK